MLMMFADDMQKIPLEKACPLNQEDLLVILDLNIAISLCNIQDDRNNFFSIKSIVEKGSVFGKTDFAKRCEEFAQILNTRLERFFVTGKTDYIFFDKEEQNYIKEIFDKNRLNCVVNIYLKGDEDDSRFEVVDFESITLVQFNKVKKYLRKYNIKYIIRPERYMELKLRRDERVDDFKKKYHAKKQENERREIEKYFIKYPELKEVKSKDEFAKLYKVFAKKYHPDVVGEDTEINFADIATDFDSIKRTVWYNNLDKEKEESEQVNTNNEPVSETINQPVKKDKGKGRIYKMFEFMVSKDN